MDLQTNITIEQIAEVAPWFPDLFIALLEGRVKSLAMTANIDDATCGKHGAVWAMHHIDEGESVYSLIGALESLKHDVLMADIQQFKPRWKDDDDRDD